ASVSLDEVLFQDSESDSSLMDVLEDKEDQTAEDRLLEKEQFLYLDKAVKKLSEREQTILQLYYVEELPLKEIAYIFDISVPRVSQIHGKTLLKLREYMRSDYHD